MNKKVMLVQPPFFRLVGSHNDHIPLELCYLNTYLRNADIDSIVFNADWIGATRYLKWKKLFQNFHFLQDATNGFSPLYDETIERILSYNPSIVVISAGDNLLPWVDVGNAYVAAILSDRLRSIGIYTIGVSPFFSVVPGKFIAHFDVILRGIASPNIIDVVKKMPKGMIINGKQLTDFNIIVNTETLPNCIDDIVITSIGCPFSCNFCLGKEYNFVNIPYDFIVSDILNRKAMDIDIGDSIFTLNISRIMIHILINSGHCILLKHLKHGIKSIQAEK